MKNIEINILSVNGKTELSICIEEREKVSPPATLTVKVLDYDQLDKEIKDIVKDKIKFVIASLID